MKTAGERIRQARESLGWSAALLAEKVGYKTQSGISNLENRISGSGGHKLRDIANALGVSVEWLLNGPDGSTVPFITVTIDAAPASDLATALGVLARYLQMTDIGTRRKSLGLIADLAIDPASHDQVALAIKVMIDAANRRQA
jgi:transcriptional regulator with XRE-family HTH domain